MAALRGDISFRYLKQFFLVFVCVFVCFIFCLLVCFVFFLFFFVLISLLFLISFYLSRTTKKCSKIDVTTKYWNNNWTILNQLRSCMRFVFSGIQIDLSQCWHYNKLTFNLTSLSLASVTHSSNCGLGSVVLSSAKSLSSLHSSLYSITVL